MTTESSGGFDGFLRETCGSFLGHLAAALGVPIAVVDNAGEIVFGAGAGEGDLPPSGAPGLVVPLVVDGDAFGVLRLGTGDESLRPLAESLAGEIGARFRLEHDILQMTDDLAFSYDRLNLMYRFASALRADDGFSDSARRLVEETADLMEERLIVEYIPGQNCFAWSAGPDARRTEIVRRLPGDRRSVESILRELIASTAGRKGPGDARLRGDLDSPYGPISYLVVPVRTRKKIAGFVGLFGGESDAPFGTGEIRLLESLARELSNTSTTLELRREVRQLLFNVVRSLVATIEAKDEYTRGHSERVFRVSVQVAERLGLPHDEIQNVSWAALLHDVGKISIDENILNKPGRLTDEEYEAIKSHPSAGAKMLEPIFQLHKIIPGIRHHHERFDGTGYPDGLAGDAIPIISRIISVADTFDAIVSARPYRKARGEEKALAVIREVAGSQLDPEVVRAFLALAGEGVVWHGAADAERAIFV